MAPRPTLTDVAMSTWSQPFAGLAPDNKTISVQGPYNAQQAAAATTDVVSVSADYGVYDTTANINLDVNSTNFKDPF